MKTPREEELEEQIRLLRLDVVRCWLQVIVLSFACLALALAFVAAVCQ
jgi:hypothetical protein